MISKDTICAIATPAGNGAIAVIRLSGDKSYEILTHVFNSETKDWKANSIVYGNIVQNSEIIDEVLVSFFKNPKSYTGEDSIEISCHGSTFIQQKILELLINHGARIAQPGEFTMRAFFNGKLDLSQAEAVADLIACTSENSHRIAINQVRGGFSKNINSLRSELLDFASLIELELDFGEEEVEFADRTKLLELSDKIYSEIDKLVDSYKLGNVIKKGIPVAIIGLPNVGKSTLLNVLLNEEKAIVSDIPGTTRDAIEDTYIINGVNFRFIDTAGLRHSTDTIEKIGIAKTYEKINQASIILYVVDISETTIQEITENINDFKSKMDDPNKKIILIANKIDKLMDLPKGGKKLFEWETIFVSAKRKENIQLIADSLMKAVVIKIGNEDTIVSNARHYEALVKTKEAMTEVQRSLNENISGDLLAMDIRQAIHYLGEITGQITTDEILGNIFSRFCIGK
ncbi:MAG TPA: tRNA uridine-5-carboxymethylaminomethyl(34) synthesis GTPase MnmE [Bacteroidales bacterium]|nr:MAG: tRNA uridine-5-carboxymethylaminomethyl(34) synthesis GTPase MnmE [Bacteroidetes bacterium GWF2_33_38]OFY76709.1 MAG: tRNA uridine-5-carboxymethylaminomethyl(34) synthesis GTPase MnmE [Bacteroidetes bacterium RIFOXYA12_FULL_33_9]OFY90622.1 MAG: tRNA uridine-5-carboxymethylaminomethyl(34) synthesis GTPase MnmE [Bacteroidetes bacterium RIFOXYA2_FULL_33_7]HBF87132.1 tRNA uridine-5-carboxymethylaminomethyl(34) synthesis GTPase MnmE [Bacteroidales bacterium]